MANQKIHLKIITPEKIVFDDEVDFISAQGTKGSFGVYPNHVPFMSVLAVDTAKVVKDGKEMIFSIIGGAFQLKDNQAVILSEVAENGEDIDTARAELAKERAEASLASAQTTSETKKANLAIAKAMARLKAASKR